MLVREIARVIGVGTTAMYKCLRKKKMGKYKPTYRPGIVFYYISKSECIYNYPQKGN